MWNSCIDRVYSAKDVIEITEIRSVSVSQINAYIKRIIDSNGVLNNFWIHGEISNFKRHQSGHLYITLKDENSVIKAVMFKSYAATLNFNPKDGMLIIARGRIGVYEANGTYQLYIEEMLQSGTGDLQAKFEKLKLRLEAEGLFDETTKKPIPKIPTRVGVCTAVTGAAVRDIINVITRRFPLAEIIVFPTIVQGEQAAASIVSAIEWFNKNNAADVLIVGRGGGSIEDLWAFNEEVVAYCIFNSNIPIISAVGHETDFTIADFVSDLRAPTPSAAAELAVPSFENILDKLSDFEKTIIKNINDKLEFLKLRADKTYPAPPTEYITKTKSKFLLCDEKLNKNIEKVFVISKNRYSALVANLDTLSPLSVLSRGYSIPFDKNGNIIRTSTDLKSGDRFLLKMTDGIKNCIVDD